VQARTLTGADVAEWRARMPGSVPRVVLPVALGCLIAVSIGVNIATQVTTTAEQTQGWASPIDAAAYGAAIGAVAMLPLRPRVATWAVVLGALAMAADPMLPSLRTWWAASAVVALLVGVLDTAGAARQDVVARGWGAPEVPRLTAETQRWILRWRALPVLIGLVALVGAGVCLGFWNRDLRAVEAFRAGAVVADGPIVAADPSGEWVDVSVGERTIRASTDSTHYDVGRVVSVRYAPGGSRAELLDHAFDPAGPFIPAAGGVVIAAVLLVAEALRWREVRRIVTLGGVAVRLRAVAVPPRSQPAIQLAVPVVALDLVPLSTPHPGGPVLTRLRVRPVASSEEDARGGRAVEAADEAPVDVASLTDEELLDLAHGLVPTEPVADAPDDTDGVVVIGLQHEGSHPLVLVDGAWMASVQPAVDPLVLRGARGRRAIEDRSAWASFRARAGVGTVRLLRGTGPLAPWFAVPLVYVAFRWLASAGFDPRLLYLAAMGGLIGYRWVGLVRPRLRLAKTGLWFQGGVYDEFFAWSLVERVVADDHGLVVRLPDGVAAIGVPRRSRSLSWLLPGVDDPLEAARVAEDARLRSGTLPFSGPVPGSLPARTGRHEAEHGQRRASPQIACGVAWVLGALLGLTGWIH